MAIAASLAGCGKREPDAAPAKSEASDEHGDHVLTLDHTAQALSGVVLAPLKADVRSKEVEAYGLVIDAPDVPSDDVARNGRGQTDTGHDATLPTPIAEEPPVRVQTALPRALQGHVPPTATLSLPDGTSVPAVLVSRPADSVSRRATVWYRPQVELNRFLPGLRVKITWSVGQPMRGVIIPEPAVVWLDGRAWVYVTTNGFINPLARRVAADEAPAGPQPTPAIVRRGEDQRGGSRQDPPPEGISNETAESAHPCEAETLRLVRHEVPLTSPVPEGWFVTEEFAPGACVAVTGAQQLLSEEFRSELARGEE